MPKYHFLIEFVRWIISCDILSTKTEISYKRIFCLYGYQKQGKLQNIRNYHYYFFNPYSGGPSGYSLSDGVLKVPAPSRSPQNTVKKRFFLIF